MRNRRGGVEGKFWALAVMDHKRTVYRAGTGPSGENGNAGISRAP
jgi:hypothetical protein